MRLSHTTYGQLALSNPRTLKFVVPVHLVWRDLYVSIDRIIAKMNKIIEAVFVWFRIRIQVPFEKASKSELKPV
jgi:hypothetical protein